MDHHHLTESAGVAEVAVVVVAGAEVLRDGQALNLNHLMSCPAPSDCGRSPEDS